MPTDPYIPGPPEAITNEAAKFQLHGPGSREKIKEWQETEIKDDKKKKNKQKTSPHPTLSAPHAPSPCLVSLLTHGRAASHAGRAPREGHGQGDIPASTFPHQHPDINIAIPTSASLIPAQSHLHALAPEERAAGSITGRAGCGEPPPRPGLLPQPLLARSPARHRGGSAAFVPSPSSLLTHTHTRSGSLHLTLNVVPRQVGAVGV